MTSSHWLRRMLPVAAVAATVASGRGLQGAAMAGEPAESFRQTAESATVIAHHCEILMRVMAAGRTSGRRSSSARTCSRPPRQPLAPGSPG